MQIVLFASVQALDTLVPIPGGDRKALSPFLFQLSLVSYMVLV